MEEDRADQTAFGASGVERAPIPPPTREPGPAERMLLAGIGAVATALDEAGEVFDRFVDRGRQVQTEIRDRALDARLQNAAARYHVRDSLRSTMDAFLGMMEVPSKTDVDTINVKLNILTRKIDDLHMQAGGEFRHEPAVTPPPASSDLAT